MSSAAVESRVKCEGQARIAAMWSRVEMCLSVEAVVSSHTCLPATHQVLPSTHTLFLTQRASSVPDLLRNREHHLHISFAHIMPPARHPSITLKQAKLSFGATKRTNSINSIKIKAKGSSPALSRTSSTVLDTVTRKRTRSTEVISDSEEELDPDAKLGKTISSDVERSTVATSEPDLYDFESEVEDKVEVPPVKKRRTALPKPRNEPLVKAQPTKLNAEFEKVEAVPLIETTVKDEKVERRKLNVNDKCYRKHYDAVREKMGNLKPGK
jgi:hypothetical protein